MKYDNILKNIKRIHFIGIGGSGMCPLAEILHEKGYYLTGSDNNETDTLKRIRNMGIDVKMGHCAENINGEFYCHNTCFFILCYLCNSVQNLTNVVKII